MAHIKKRDLTEGVWLVLKFLALLWAIQVVNYLLAHFLHYRLNDFGVIPRTKRGIVGIFCGPFLHGNWWHLIGNSVPLFFLGSLVAIRGKRLFLSVSVTIGFVSGFALWCVGREAIHIGVSGVIFGYLGYLVGRACFERSLSSILIAVVAVFFYGGIIGGVFPGHKGISWEAHLCGLITGVLVASGEECKTKKLKLKRGKD